MLDVPTVYQLSARGILTEGYVTNTEPENHQTVHYAY